MELENATRHLGFIGAINLWAMSYLERILHCSVCMQITWEFLGCLGGTVGSLRHFEGDFQQTTISAIE
jgi:hypothetical protein